MKKEIVHKVRARYVGAPATPQITAPLLCVRERMKKYLDDCDNPDFLVTYQETTETSWSREGAEVVVRE
jgi:hypothetical protein